jgi:hypothetical protein
MDQLETEIVELCLYMGGGLTWDIAWELSFSARKKMFNSINKKLQASNGSKKEYM